MGPIFLEDRPVNMFTNRLTAPKLMTWVRFPVRHHMKTSSAVRLFSINW